MNKLHQVSQLRILILLFAILLSGCKEILYTGLSEKEGAEMLSILLEQGVDAEKTSNQKGQTVTLMVESSALSQAIQILKSHGYPKDNFTSVGELFQKDGLISSPLEERARYIYGLSQEIAATLSQLDGVITARVHVVMPEIKDKKEALKIPSASVFIKYESTYNLSDYVPQIKLLVNNSIEGLSFDNIAVALFPTQAMVPLADKATVNFLSISVSKQSLPKLLSLIAFLMLIIIAAVVGNVILYRRLQRPTVSVLE